MKQKLESKEQDFTELLSKYQMSVSERDLMEEQLSVMKEKAKESDAKLNEVKVNERFFQFLKRLTLLIISFNLLVI